MINGLRYHNFTIKGCFYGSQLCVMFLLVILVCYLMSTYNSDNSHRILQLIYRQNLQTSANISAINILAQTNIKINVDTLGKVEKGSNQIRMDLNKSKISNHKGSEQQISEKPSDKPKEKQNMNMSANSSGVTEAKNQNQDNNQLQKANGKPDQTIHKAAYPGINTTHVKQILMEPVSATYTRNIYFTVKTTYRYYNSRLFPLLLTWLQVVDKNKVSRNRDISILAITLKLCHFVTYNFDDGKV